MYYIENHHETIIPKYRLEILTAELERYSGFVLP